MSFHLGDDGTMDTVIVCSECGQELRYNYDGGDDGGDDDGDEFDYDAFVAWAIEEAESDHECETDALRRMTEAENLYRRFQGETTDTEEDDDVPR